MRLKDTLSKQLVDLLAVEPDKKISLYSCGPTIYDYPHIGNWYSFLRWDLLVRSLEFDGYQVVWVMNMTDVGHLVSDADDGEDKVQKRSAEEDKNAWELAEFYGDYFKKALFRLNFRQPDFLPKATDHIDHQIALAERIEAAGYAYLTDDGLYFDTAKFNDYGRLLSPAYLEGLRAGARIEVDFQKKTPTDFAIWKLTPEDKNRDMDWPSPWGVGFPGWHLECSAMAHHYLSSPMTIHSGGIDLIPIHHTNELAQTEVGYQSPLAKIWVHSNFVLIDNQKMSKSVGNVYTLETITKAGYNLSDFRLAVFSSRYNTQVNFTWGLMKDSRIRRYRWQALAALVFQLEEAPVVDDQVFIKALVATKKAIVKAINDDLNSPRALMLVDRLISQHLKAGWSTKVGDALTDLIETLDHLFGLELKNSVANLTEDQARIYQARDQARIHQDFETGDRYRDQLRQEGIDVVDDQLGPRWQPLLEVDDQE